MKRKEKTAISSKRLPAEPRVREEWLHVYLDSSVVLRKLFRQSGSHPAWEYWETARSSELLKVEVLRSLDRARMEGVLAEREVADHRSAFLDWVEGLDLIQLSPRVLARASESFPVPLATLDAIHLATALAWKGEVEESLVLWTHDRRLALAARSVGLGVEGV